jgi:hypothetical protein
MRAAPQGDACQGTGVPGACLGVAGEGRPPRRGASRVAARTVVCPPTRV